MRTLTAIFLILVLMLVVTIANSLLIIRTDTTFTLLYNAGALGFIGLLLLTAHIIAKGFKNGLSDM